MKALYIHGFNSAGFGGKVNVLRQFWGPEVVNPSLPTSPQEAMALLNYLAPQLKAPDFCVVGSSLGGLYALQLACNHGVNALLINPGFLNLKTGLAYALGELTNYKTQETHVFTEADLDYLEGLELTTQDYKHIASHVWAYFDAGDEVLPSHQNARFLSEHGIYTQVYEGGNHQFEHMTDMLNDFAQRLLLPD